MTFKEAIGVDVFDRDLKTGERISLEEANRRAIDFLGGLDEIAQYIPFPASLLKERIKLDPYLNNTSLYKWEVAAGFDSILGQNGNVVFRGNGIWELYHKHGITSASCADGVCLLKEAARMIVAQMD